MRTTAPIIVIGTLLLAACSTATMNKDECRAVDWRTVGYEDGVAGRSGEQVGEHRRACAAYGVTPDLEAYRAGRAEGLREYCQPHNAYRAGTSGAVYYDGCPADLAPAFVKAYDAGHELYVRERRVSDTDEEIAHKRRQIAYLEDRVANQGFRFISEDATPEERVDAVLDTRQIAERIGRLRSEIVELEKDRARYARELDTYRETLASTR